MPAGPGRKPFEHELFEHDAFAHNPFECKLPERSASERNPLTAR